MPPQLARSICRAELTKIAAVLAGTAPRRPVRLIDASWIEAPGGAAWRLHLCFDPQQARMLQAAVTPIRHGERLDRLAVQGR